MSDGLQTYDEIKAYLFDAVLPECLHSFRLHGRYWYSSMPGDFCMVLRDLIVENGYRNVLVQEVPPKWEFVFYLPEHSHVVESVAERRSLGESII